MVGEVRDQRWRLITLCVLFAGFAGLLLFRTYSYQVVQYQRFHELASQEHQLKKQIMPRRGDILDRNGNPLVVTVMYQSLYAYPSSIKDPSTVASKLSPLIGDPAQDILAKLQTNTKGAVLIKSKLPADVSTKIANLNLPGVYLQQQPFRAYPEGSIAAQLLGFVGEDFNGLAGLELSLNKELAGQPGLLDAEQDTSGEEIAIGRTELIPARNGSDAILTIDRYIQRMVEQELAQGVKKYKARGGFVIVMDPKTGGILAMADQPTYDLTAETVYNPSHAQLYKPTAVTNVYEPGSVMKVVTMSAGINEKLITPDTAFIDHGTTMIDGVEIHNWNYEGPGRETMTQVLINSANVGAAYVSGLLGPDRFYKYVEAFGFGKPTGIDLPGEASGYFRTPKDPAWTRIDLATNAFGQGIAVTPIQMITAVATIANGGVLMKPMVVKAFRNGSSIQDVPPVQVRRVISTQTAKAVTGMMVHVTDDNSLRLGVVPGYKIASKTGTADLPTPEGYTSGLTYASQVGFAPADDPKFVMLVRLDAPKAIYGGTTATPLWKSIAEKLFNYMQIPPSEPIATKTPAAH